MSNRPVFFLCLHLRHKKEKPFRFFFALPLFVVFALADMLEDWAEIASLFRPRNKCAFTQTARAVSNVIWEFAFHTGPLDIVNIDVQSEKETLFLRLGTR